jgi:D-glycero-D-manno-heptose 1,7-bisphosphate phosphatase
MNAAVFLDRDGTLIEEREFLCDPDQVAPIRGVDGALRRLQEAGFLLFLVTNQSGVGRGLFTLEDVHSVHRRLLDLLEPSGVHLAAIYVAPEAPDQPSHGRKPSPQFLFDARDAFQVDLGSSYMVGDKAIDVECGLNAGVRKSLLVRTGYGAAVEAARHPVLERTGAAVVDDIAAAADWILAHSPRPHPA